MSYKESTKIKELLQLAQTPLDLTQEGVITTERINAFKAEAVGFQLFYATERVTEEAIKDLYTLAHDCQVLEKMEKMQSGVILNFIEGFPSENRAVLHTATRDFFDNPQTAKPAVQATQLALAEVLKLEQFLKEIDERFTDLIVIGIGGSELGPKAIYLALEAYKKKNRRVFFVGNVDPDDIVKNFREVDLNKTLVCVVSKSGTTLETTVNEAFARSLYIKQGLDPTKFFISVTGEKSPMDDPEKYLKSFYIWDWIGGRYSASSIIGGIILGFSCGLPIYQDFLKGAHAMDQNALVKNERKNLPLLGALLGLWNHNFLKIESCAIIPYSQALSRFPAHLQQLDMESNGKQINRQGKFVDYMTGPIIWGEAGTNAQHSFYQHIHQGKVPICLELIGFAHSQLEEDFHYQNTSSQQKLIANLFAQALALAVGQKNSNPNQVFLGNRPSHILFGDRLTPFALGSLLAYFEHKVVFQGFLWDINSFDQEGVQLGKKLADRILKLLQNKEAYPEAEAFLKQTNVL